MATKTGNILVIDDDPDVLKAANLLLKRHFHQVVIDENPEHIPQHMAASQWDVVMLDMNFEPGANDGDEGLKWLSVILNQQPNALVILMTAYGAVDTAVKAIKQGAIDFVLKPWQNERLLTTINSALRLGDSHAEVLKLKSRQQEMVSNTASNALVGDSLPMRALRNVIERVSPTDASILILGENGTGKEVVAREIYQHSSRNKDVFVSVDLGSVAESLFESELFGHKKGSFTGATADRIGRFQAADGGTLFLDEIGNLPLNLQGKLLTAIEQREVVPVGSNTPVKINVRLICATNKHLIKMVAEESFREDLLYRINTVEMVVPPLREHKDDIGPLMEHFVTIYAQKYQIEKPAITSTTIQQLQNYYWPGNIRELRHAVERALILNTSGQLEASDLLTQSKSASNPDNANSPDNAEEKLNLESVEQKTIEKSLKKHSGNISHAAKELGITRTSLYRRMEKYGI